MVGAFDGLQDKCDLGPQQVAMLLKHLAKPVFLMGREFFTGKKGLFGLLIQFQERSVGLVINHVQVKVDLEGVLGVPLLLVLALTKCQVFGGSCFDLFPAKFSGILILRARRQKLQRKGDTQ